VAYPVCFQGAGGTGILKRKEEIEGLNQWISQHGPVIRAISIIGECSCLLRPPRSSAQPVVFSPSGLPESCLACSLSDRLLLDVWTIYGNHQ
jgi:hypothetical protein